MAIVVDIMKRYHVSSPHNFLLSIIDAIGTFFFRYQSAFPKDPKEIAVIRLDHIGDLIMTSPFLESLKKNFPNAKITLLCGTINKDIVRCIPGVDHVEFLDVPWFARKNKMTYRAVFSWAKKNRKKYDLSFELHTDPRNIVLARLISKHVVSYTTRGFGFLADTQVTWKIRKKHTVERNLDLLRALKIPIFSTHLRIAVTDGKLKEGLEKIKMQQEQLRNTIVINTGAGAPGKVWSEENFSGLCALLLRKTLFNVLLVDSDASRTKKISRQTQQMVDGFQSKRLYDGGGKISLVELCAITKECEIIVSLDSMQQHIGSCFDKKIVTIFSSINDPVIWGPLSRHARVMQKKPVNSYHSLEKSVALINSITPQEVFKEILQIANIK